MAIKTRVLRSSNSLLEIIQITLQIIIFLWLYQFRLRLREKSS